MRALFLHPSGGLISLPSLPPSSHIPHPNPLLPFSVRAHLIIASAATLSLSLFHPKLSSFPLRGRGNVVRPLSSPPPGHWKKVEGSLQLRSVRREERKKGRARGISQPSSSISSLQRAPISHDLCFGVSNVTYIVDMTLHAPKISC